MNRELALFKPEQMLNYVEEILASDTSDKEQSILQTMFEYITRTKLKWEIALERLLYQFLDLSFQLRKQYLIKEVLKAYRMLTQQQYTDSLKTVLEYYRNKRLDVVLKEIEKRPLQECRDIEDIESEESPENLLISSFRIDEKRQRDELKNNMRIVWDGYKSIIETVKINQRLEDLYHETLQLLFNFADKYNRKHEFKRYCDTIRTGLQTIFKNKQDRTEAQKAIYIDIDDAIVNEKNVQIRLEQFEVATKLGLWQESFQVLEDINLLMKTRKGTVKKRTRARYFLNLSKLFKKSNYWNYHAFTYFNYYNTNRSNPELTPEDIGRMTDELLLAVMCIPPFSIERNQNEESQNKICSLVTSTNHIPDKAELYRLVLEKGIIQSASDHIKRLWTFLFVEFKILEVPSKLELLEAVRNSPLQEFTTLLEDIIIYKELIEVSKIYSKVRLENILRMVPFDKQKVISIMLRTKEHEVLQFEFDESNNLIIFKQKESDTDPFIIVKKLAREVAYLAEKVRRPNRDEIVRHAQMFLDDAKELYFRIRPYKSQQFREKLKQPMRELRNEELDRERKEQAEKEEQDRIRKEQQNEQRRKEILHQRELATKKDKIKDIIKIKGNRVVKTLGKKIETLDDADLEDLTLEGLDALIKETEAKNKQDAENKYKKAFSKVDYLERARRQNITPILQADWNEANKQMGAIQESLRQTFQQQLDRKTKILPAREYIEKELKEQTVKREEEHLKAVAEYKKRITFEYKERILARAKELREEDIKREKEIKEQNERRAAEALKTQSAADSDNWRRGPQTQDKPAETGKVGEKTQQSAGDVFGTFRSRQPQQPVAATATTAQQQPQGPPRFTSSTNPQPPVFQARGPTPATTTTTPPAATDNNWRTAQKTESTGSNPLFRNTGATNPPTTATSSTSGAGFNFRERKEEAKKEQPKEPPKKQEPAKQDGGWRRGT